MKLLLKILKSQQIKNVLDIGAGKGLYSLVCASYGANVDAVDPDIMKGFKYFDFLYEHPRITRYQMMIHEFEIQKNYDLVLLLDVIMFLKKDFVLSRLLPSVAHHLQSNGKLIFSFFLPDDDAVKSSTKMTQYTTEEIIKAVPSLNLVESFDEAVNEDHPPVGPHQHHIQYMVFSKN